MSHLIEWRDEHLKHVGVPSNFQQDWDFVSAVTACESASPSFCPPPRLTYIFRPCVPGASDATYHIMWIILFNALDDFGIREVNDLVRTGSPGNTSPNHTQIETIKKKFSEEALHGALRIAGLAGVLTSNGYLVRFITLVRSLIPTHLASPLAAPRLSRHARFLHPSRHSPRPSRPPRSSKLYRWPRAILLRVRRMCRAGRRD